MKTLPISIFEAVVEESRPVARSQPSFPVNGSFYSQRTNNSFHSSFQIFFGRINLGFGQLDLILINPLIQPRNLPIVIMPLNLLVFQGIWNEYLLVYVKRSIELIITCLKINLEYYLIRFQATFKRYIL